MYLSNATGSIYVSTQNVTNNFTTDIHASYQDVNSNGMVLPQVGFSAKITGSNSVTLVTSPPSQHTRHVTFVNISNTHPTAVRVQVLSNISGVVYTLFDGSIKAFDTLTWTRETGWGTYSGKNTSHLSLTTTGTTGNATLINNVLNVPNYTGVTQLNLPQVAFKIGDWLGNDAMVDIKLYFLPTENEEWRNHSPQVWLFRANRKRKKKYYNILYDDWRVKTRYAKWSHPGSSNRGIRNGINGVNGTAIYDRGLRPNVFRITEWDIPSNAVPYLPIPNFSLDLHSFYSVNDPNINELIPSDPSLWPTGEIVMASNARNSKNNVRKNTSTLFMFRVVCRDPRNSNNLIFGPPSPILKVFPQKNNGVYSFIGASSFTYRGY